MWVELEQAYHINHPDRQAVPQHFPVTAFVDPNQSGTEGDTTTTITDMSDHMPVCRASMESGESWKVEVTEGQGNCTTPHNKVTFSRYTWPPCGGPWDIEYNVFI